VEVNSVAVSANLILFGCVSQEQVGGSSALVSLVDLAAVRFTGGEEAAFFSTGSFLLVLAAVFFLAGASFSALALTVLAAFTLVGALAAGFFSAGRRGLRFLVGSWGGALLSSA
jgi:hypothetical protein